MTKLPVFKAVGTTLAFVLEHWLDLLKIMWLPLVLVILLSAAVAPAYMQGVMAVGQSGGSDPEQALAAMSATLPMALLLMLVSIAAYLIIFAGILKLVILGEKPSLPFYLGFGSDEWRLLGTWALQILIFIGAELVLTIAVTVAGAVAVNIPGAGVVILLVLSFAGLAAFIWLGLRLSLTTPAAIGAQTIGIGPSWNATKGNVWRLLGYWLILGLLFLAITIALMLIIMPGYFQGIADMIGSGGNPDQLQRASREMTEAGLAIYDLSSPINIVRMVASNVVGMFVFATMAVAGGVAWRLMTDDHPEKHFE